MTITKIRRRINPRSKKSAENFFRGSNIEEFIIKNNEPDVQEYLKDISAAKKK
jgi:hypothetical protein